MPNIMQGLYRGKKSIVQELVRSLRVLRHDVIKVVFSQRCMS